MNDLLAQRSTVVAALLVGAAGIALLWAGGVEFPVAVPPGLVILLVGAAVVAGVRRTWSAWLGCALGVFVVTGFLVAGLAGDGFAYLLGREGPLVAAGQVVQLAGVVTAAVSSFLLARSGRG